jgi:hypothetical protein
MRLARRERQPQRLARPEQVRLPYQIIERARAQPFCEGGLRFLSRKQGICTIH